MTTLAVRNGWSLPTAGLDVRLLGALAVVAVIWLGLHALTGGLFLTARNLFNLSLQVTVVGVMTCGMVLVIVSRHIDLSVGSVLGFVGVFGALVQIGFADVLGAQTWWVAVLAMLAAGASIGALQGALIAYGGIPSFVVTLGGLLFFRNAAYFINKGETIAPLDPTFQLLGGGLQGSIGAFWSWAVCAAAVTAVLYAAWAGRRRRRRFEIATRPLPVEAAVTGLAVVGIVGYTAAMNAYAQPNSGVAMGLPIPVLILGAVVLSMSVLATRRRFGRHVFAYGGNPDAAVLAGVDTRRLTLKIFALMGLLVGVASVVITARLNAGASATGTMTELNVIAAAVIGGTSLAGGAGRVAGAVLGAIVMQSLESGMILMGVPSPLQKMVLALVLILAVWIDMAIRRARTP